MIRVLTVSQFGIPQLFPCLRFLVGFPGLFRTLAADLLPSALAACGSPSGADRQSALLRGSPAAGLRRCRCWVSAVSKGNPTVNSQSAVHIEGLIDAIQVQEFSS